MQIPSFSVQNQRAVRLAACDALPSVLIVTGPNGSGKSTLLNALRSTGGPGRTLYVGPHRNSRRQQVRMRFLAQQRIEMGSLLSSSSLPGFEGISLPSHERDAWNFDEAQSFLKFSLCQIEMDRQAAIAQRFDSHGAVSKADVPDIWAPLRDMTKSLLPHLEFDRIDLTNRDQIRCLFRVHSGAIHVDLDELSSGEKAVIQLFYPLLEHHINGFIHTLNGTTSATQQGPIAVLMDEPELHLHPNLQGKVLEYIRALALNDNLQFILATHSPSMVEQATSEELYLLRPAELTPGTENQLIRIASDDQKLLAMRETFGSTSNITAMRKLLVVEGSKATEDSKRPSDSRIYGFLHERLLQLTIVSAGGKSECKALVKSLNTALHELAPDLRALALTDRDIEEAEPSDPDEALLPVSMIENLLVDPKIIWDAIATVRHKIKLKSVEDIAATLDQIADAQTNLEIGRRVKAEIGSRTFRASDPISEISQQVAAFSAELSKTTSAEKIAEITTRATEKVEKLRTEHRRREFFDGKKLLETFFKIHLHGTGLSKEVFIYECARQAAARKSVKSFADGLLQRLGLAEPTHAPQAAQQQTEA